MNKYQKYLKHLGITLCLLSLAYLVMEFVTLFFAFDERTSDKVVEITATNLIPLCVGFVVLQQAQKPHWERAAIIFTAAAFVVEGLIILKSADGEIASLANLLMLLMLLCLVLMLTANSRTGRRKKILDKETISLDLRISGKDELFDPMVIAPHHEVNPRIMDAVDRFLRTEDNRAPLQLHIHSREPISENLQELMVEDFRAHYADEEKQINRFLEVRFQRAVILIAISITALWLLPVLDLDDGAPIVMTIVSNFAAFSLWQVGSTYFERSAVLPDLMRIFLAKHAQISFH